VTTGDRFAAPGVARWNGDYGVSYGDGGTALVLGRERGPFSLLAVASTSEPHLEEMHRGSEQFLKLSAAGLRGLVKTALDEAGLLPGEISAVALPRFGSDRIRPVYLPTVTSQFATNVQVLETGRHTGHLGAGDAAAHLADLHSAKSVEPGSIALLISGGTGFSWSCLIVRVEDAPQ